MNKKYVSYGVMADRFVQLGQVNIVVGNSICKDDIINGHIVYQKENILDFIFRYFFLFLKIFRKFIYIPWYIIVSQEHYVQWLTHYVE